MLPSIAEADGMYRGLKPFRPSFGVAPQCVNNLPKVIHPPTSLPAGRRGRRGLLAGPVESAGLVLEATIFSVRDTDLSIGDW